MNLIELIVLDTNLGQQRIFREIINIYIYIPVVHVIPFVTLILINVLTVRRLIKYRDEHLRLLSNSIRSIATIKSNLIDTRRHHHVTIMLMSVVLLFLLCRLPMLINQIYDVLDPVSDEYFLKDNQFFQCRIQRIFNTFASFMQTINSNGNLIIYLICCRNFRETSKELFRKLIDFIRLQVNRIVLKFIRGRSRTSTRSTEA